MQIVQWTMRRPRYRQRSPEGRITSGWVGRPGPRIASGRRSDAPPEVDRLRNRSLGPWRAASARRANAAAKDESLHDIPLVHFAFESWIAGQARNPLRSRASVPRHGERCDDADPGPAHNRVNAYTMEYRPAENVDRMGGDELVGQRGHWRRVPRHGRATFSFAMAAFTVVVVLTTTGAQARRDGSIALPVPGPDRHGVW